MASLKTLGNILQVASRIPRVVTNLTYLQARSSRYISSERTLQSDDTNLDGELHDVSVDPFACVQQIQKPFIDNIRPPLKRSFNLASYVNSSKTLQELVKIGVSLYDIENVYPKAAQQLLQLDYERDCVKYLKLLVASGLKTSNTGRFISEFPDIFQVPILELQTRFEYLKSKGFSYSQIVMALNRSSTIIAYNVKTLDHKLGQFQIEFDMPAVVLRKIISKHPTVLRHPVDQYRLINFCLTQEFGFSTRQVHTILEEQPKTIDLLRPRLIERLDLVHNSMRLSHSMITKFPKLITGPDLDIKHRFLYLRKLKRDQFNPKLPLFVQPSSLYNGTDEEFCIKWAKTSLNDYKLFVKTCL